jgi:hypothetical protein
VASSADRRKHFAAVAFQLAAIRRVGLAAPPALHQRFDERGFLHLDLQYDFAGAQTAPVLRLPVVSDFVTGGLAGASAAADNAAMSTATILPPARERPPFLPEDRDLGRSLIRACTAKALARFNRTGQTATDIAEAAWPRDRAAVTITRGAVPPLSLGGITGLQATAPGAFVAGLQLSAAARLFAAGITVDLDGIYSVSIPYADPASQKLPVFVAEGAPIPVSQGVTSSSACGPARKLALIEALTEELSGYGASNAETIIRTIMSEAAARALDAAVFSTNDDGSGTRPPGILHGVTPITAATGGGLAAAMADIGAMVAAIATAGGGRRVMVFLAPGKAVTLPMMAQSIAVELVPTPALTTSVVAVDPAGFVSAFGAEPRIDIGRESTLHMEDTTPLAIGTAGSPNTVAAPTRSMFQTDSYALRLILPCAWAMRASGLVQVVNSVTW